jgi:hypothetical protein
MTMISIGTSAMTSDLPDARLESRGVRDGGLPAPAPGSAEHVISLPMRVPALMMAIGAALVAGGWSAAVALGPWGRHEFISGMTGVVVTAAVALLGLAVMTPWKPRPMADWMTMWLGGTLFRLLGTPTVLFLLYSAASPPLAAKPLALSVALTYLVMLLAEAGALALHVRRSLPTH